MSDSRTVAIVSNALHKRLSLQHGDTGTAVPMRVVGLMCDIAMFHRLAVSHVSVAMGRAMLELVWKKPVVFKFRVAVSVNENNMMS